jgi:hypothetical protein
MTSSCSMSDLSIVQYDNILIFHGQELQHDTSLKLAHLAQADAAGNRDMAVLADHTHKDSRSMRIATAIAMFYLPVNLVMVRILAFLKFLYLIDPLGTRGCKICHPVQGLLCCPTNFRVTNATENHSSRMQVRSEVWIATVAAIVLAISTACWSWWWNWKEQKKSDKKAFQVTTDP